MGEIARRVVRKHLDQSAFIALWKRVVVEHQVVVLILRMALHRLPGPGVFLGGVVQHQIDAQADAADAQGGGHLGEILHRAVGRVHGAVIHHRIAAVAVAGARLQAGHECT
jgi:hypothetical protein